MLGVISPGDSRAHRDREHGVSQARLAESRRYDPARRSRRIERDQVSPTRGDAAARCCTCSARTWSSQRAAGSGIDRDADPEHRRPVPLGDRVRRGRRSPTSSIGGRSRRRDRGMTERTLPEPRCTARLLDRVGASGVDFVVVGGLAGAASTARSYPTFDLDIAYARRSSEPRRTGRGAAGDRRHAARGAADLRVPARSRSAIENGANFTFDTPYGDFDVLRTSGESAPTRS